jgi:hypothetical protein
MATFSITIPDADAQRIQAALAGLYNANRDPNNPMTLKEWFVTHASAMVRQWENSQQAQTPSPGIQGQ